MSEEDQMKQLIAVVHTIRRDARPGTVAHGIVTALDKEAEKACMDPDLFMAKILLEFRAEAQAQAWLATRARKERT